MVGSLICGLAPNSNAFIVGRAVAGIGASGVASGGFVIVLTVASKKSKPLLVGICASCFAMGLILAPIIGGAFTEKATWRWCFWINLPPGALTLLSMLFFFNPPSIQRDQTAVQRIKSLDLVGCAIFVPAIFMLLLAMMWGGTEKDWNSATIIGLFVGSGVMLILFACWERYQGDGAMIPGNLLARQTVTFSVLFSFCHFGSLGIVNYYMPEWFQAVQGATPLESGTRILPAVLSQIVGTLTAAFLCKSMDHVRSYQRLRPGHSAENKLLQSLALHRTSLHVHCRSIIHPVLDFQHTIQPLDWFPGDPGSRDRHGTANAPSHSSASS
jgi:MFS family permease